MRKIILPAMIVLLLLAGCSQKAPASAPQPPGTPPQPTPTQMNQTAPPPVPNPPSPPAMNASNGTSTETNQTPAGMNQSANGTGASAQNGTAASANQTNGSQMNQTQPPPSPPSPPSPASYSIDANDGGFYMGGNQISSLDVKSGTEVVITFNVLTTEVYHGGLDFRGCGQATAGAPPGESVDMRFTPSASCSISSYWPSTGVLKHTLAIKAG